MKFRALVKRVTAIEAGAEETSETFSENDEDGRTSASDDVLEFYFGPPQTEDKLGEDEVFIKLLHFMDSETEM